MQPKYSETNLARFFNKQYAVTEVHIQQLQQCHSASVYKVI